jgi:hypothetical protein
MWMDRERERVASLRRRPMIKLDVGRTCGLCIDKGTRNQQKSK